MAVRLSTGLRNFLARQGSYANAFRGGRLMIYSGSQPTTADDAVAGTLLVTITAASGAWVAETPGYASTELTGGGGGSVNTLVANGIEIMGSATAFNGSLAQTAADIVAKINAFGRNQYGIVAVISGTVIIKVWAPVGSGATWNTLDITAGLTTITVTDTDFAAGVTAVNGLTFGLVTAGVLAKGSEVWSGVAANSGTAGWFRLVGCIADAGASSSTLIRLDGNISTSGANLNLASTTITAAATTTIDTFSVTIPAS